MRPAIKKNNQKASPVAPRKPTMPTRAVIQIGAQETRKMIPKETKMKTIYQPKNAIEADTLSQIIIISDAPSKDQNLDRTAA